MLSLLASVTSCRGNSGPPVPSDLSPGTGGGASSSWSAACGARVNQAPAPSVDPYCPPVEELAAWVAGRPECPDQVYPSERELVCNAAKLPRKPMPATVITTELDWGNLDDRVDGHRLHEDSARYIFDLTDALDQAGLPRDMSAPPLSGIPPFFEFHGPNQTVDLASETATLQVSLRSYGAQLLRERAKGKIGFFAYGLGAHEPQPPNTTVVAELEAAIHTIMAPRVEMAAKAAEAVNAEVFYAFPGEADILATMPALASVPAADRFRLVQELVDTVRISARKHFTGKLMGASAWRYYPVDHPLYSAIDMSKIRWAGFDYVEFTLLIATNDSCDPAFTTAFIAAQTATIDAMARRDHFAWGSAEIDLFTFDSVKRVTGTGGCTTAPRDAYFPVLDALLAGFLAAPSRPAFLNFTAGPSAWSADAAFHQQLRERLLAFETAIKQPK